MSTNSTLPETEDNSTLLQEEEESFSSGNGWLAIVVGVIFLLAIAGYMFMPGEGGRRRIASVMPSVMLGEASVTGARPVEEAAAAPTAEAADAAEEAKPSVAVLPRSKARPAAEMSLDSRPVAAVSSEAEPIAEAAPAITAPAAPTTLTLTGRILDENGRPLAGATVLLRGSRKGTGTDANGNYSLEVPAGDNSLVYGYGGYQDQEVRTRGSQPISVTLLPNEAVKKRRN